MRVPVIIFTLSEIHTDTAKLTKLQVMQFHSYEIIIIIIIIKYSIGLIYFVSAPNFSVWE